MYVLQQWTVIGRWLDSHPIRMFLEPMCLATELPAQTMGLVGHHPLQGRGVGRESKLWRDAHDFLPLTTEG